MAETIEAGACLVHSETDLVAVRSLLRVAAEAGELSTVEMTKFITAGSELARNIVTYAGAGGGMVTAAAVTEANHCGVRAVFSDRGPGIPDIDEAMQDGFSSSGSLGLGLPGARRLVDEFSIESTDKGTTVILAVWHR